MDRLPPVISSLTPFLLWGSLAACTGAPEAKPTPEAASEAASEATTGRGEAPKPVAPAADARQVEGFCDKRVLGDDAKTFSWPAMDSAAPASEAGRWRWVNLWATWCVPCTTEMPLLVEWQKKLGQEGVAYDLTFLSVDTSASDVSGFYASHANFPASLRFQKYGDVAGWVQGTGLDGDAVIPIHLFVDPNNKVRCARMGAIHEADLPIVRQILQGG